MKNIRSYRQILTESLNAGIIWAVQSGEDVHFYDTEKEAEEAYNELSREEAHEAWENELRGYGAGELRDPYRYEAEEEAFMQDYAPENTYMLDPFDLSEPGHPSAEDIVDTIKKLKDVDALLELAEKGLNLKIYFDDPQDLLNMIDQRAEMMEKKYGKKRGIIGMYWTGQEKQKKKDKQMERLRKIWSDLERQIKSTKLFGI